MTPEQALQMLAAGIRELPAPYAVHQQFTQCVNVLQHAITPEKSLGPPEVPPLKEVPAVEPVKGRRVK